MDTQAVTLTRLEELLLRSPAGREMLAEQQRQEARKRLVDEIGALREEADQVLPRLKGEVEEAKQKVLSARKVLERAEADFRGKNGVCAGVDARLQAGIARRLSALRESASPAIDEFVTQCRRAITKARNSFVVRQVSLGTHSAETGRPIYRTETNAEEIAAKVKTYEAAIKEAENLKLAALSDSEVEERLQALASTLPAEVRPQPLVDVDGGYHLTIAERSEALRQGQPWRDTKSAIHRGLGLGSFRQRR
jgi:hypothetical protein